MNDKNLIPIEFSDYLRSNFLNYAASVAKDRALVRLDDGLKPVARRIIQSMYHLGLHPNSTYKKCARTVGDVLGRLHPHGDSSVYEAMVNMAQPFKMRYPLIEIQGNIGSIDGDPPAAMRYTEGRLSRYGELLMNDYEKNVVDDIPNYDESEQEATVLPGLFPNLLLNGTYGIAVGVVSSFLPHCAKDIYAALDLILVNALESIETNIDDVIDIVKAPDFPTGGIITNSNDIANAYRIGSGSVVVQSKYEIEELKNGKHKIVITEIPYRVNKARLIEQIVKQKNDGVIPNIADIRDESNKDGLRIVIEVNKSSNIQWVINTLLKNTDMQSSISMKCVALYPKDDGSVYAQGDINLLEMMEIFLNHAVEVTRRSIQFDHDKAMSRMHIVSGLVKAIDVIDEIYEANKKAKDKADAIYSTQFIANVDDGQATAIINMKLWNLNENSRDELMNEYNSLASKIQAYSNILEDDILLVQEVRNRLRAVAEIFDNDKRLTEISNNNSNLTTERDCIRKEDIIIIYTHNKRIKSVKLNEYTSQNRNGKGVSSNLDTDDFIEQVVALTTIDDLVFITNTGRAYVLPAYSIPIGTRTSAAKYIVNFLSLEQNEKIITMLPLRHDDTEHSILFVTKKGIAKRLAISDLPCRKTGAQIIHFKDGDELVNCVLVKDSSQILIASANGFGIRLNVSRIRIMGRMSVGVVIMRFKEDTDHIVSVVSVEDDDEIAIVSEKGYGKRMKVSSIGLLENRGGKGVTIYKTSKREDKVVSVLKIEPEKTIVIITSKGMIIRIAIDSLPLLSTNAANGISAIKLNENDVVRLALLAPEQCEKETQ